MFLIMSYKRIQRERLKRLNLTSSRIFSNYSEISRKENNYHIQIGSKHYISLTIKCLSNKTTPKQSVGFAVLPYVHRASGLLLITVDLKNKQ